MIKFSQGMDVSTWGSPLMARNDGAAACYIDDNGSSIFVKNSKFRENQKNVLLAIRDYISYNNMIFEDYLKFLDSGGDIRFQRPVSIDII